MENLKKIYSKNLRNSEYWEDIVDRLVDSDLEEDDEPSDEQVKKEDDITMWYITQLSHDGDSEDGYTLLEAK